MLRGILALLILAAPAQQKGIPTQEEVLAALAKLEKDPTDPDANTIAGKYKAFVMGEYEAAMPYLVHSKDGTLKSLAERELDAPSIALAAQKYALGEDWAAAARKLPALSRPLLDRANHWYLKAWPDLDPPLKKKARDQSLKVVAARPPGSPRKALPGGWASENGAVHDGTIARTGSYSAKLPPPDPKIKGGSVGLRSDLTAINGKVLEVSTYVRSDGTDDANDKLFVNWWGQNGQWLSNSVAFVPIDVPYWSLRTIKVNLSADVARIQFGIENYSKAGTIWIDDISIKIDGKEVLKNGSLEEK